MRSLEESPLEEINMSNLVMDVRPPEVNLDGQDKSEEGRCEGISCRGNTTK